MPPFYKSFQSSSTTPPPPSSPSSKSSNNKKQSHYNVLELETTATFDEIKTARKRLAKTWHPDKNPENENFAHVKQQQINEAYRILSDEKLKEEYDFTLKYGKKSGASIFREKYSNQSDGSDSEGGDSSWFEKRAKRGNQRHSEDEPLYKFKGELNAGEETYFTKSHIYMIFQMKVLFEKKKYGDQSQSTEFQDFLDLFERQETASEKYWKKVLWIAAALFVTFLLSPTLFKYVFPVIFNPSFWYLPADFIFHIFHITKGFFVLVVGLGFAVVFGALLWWLVEEGGWLKEDVQVGEEGKRGWKGSKKKNGKKDKKDKRKSPR